MKIPRILMGALAAALVCGCVEQEPDRPTEEDLRIIKENILSKAPDIKIKLNASFEGKVVYLGMDVDKEVIKPGEQFTLVHYWKVIQPVEGWKVFVHINGPNNSGFINADHRPIGGRYPAAKWKKGEIIRDEHQVTLPANWKGNQMMVYTGLWKGRLRLKVTGPQDSENRLRAATLPVDASASGGATLKRLIAIKTTTPVEVDGKLDEEIWAKAPSTGRFVETMQGGPSPINTEAKVAWDDKFLYVAFTCEDEDIWGDFKKRDDKLWEQEAVEIFIDANGDGKDYIELQVNPHNAVFDSFLPAYRKNQNDWNSKVKTAVVVDGTLDKRGDKDKGWTVEIALPWEDVRGKATHELTLPPKVGDLWRMNFFRLDAPENKPKLAAAWSAPLVGDFHKLDRFGEVIFGDEKGEAPEPKAQAVAPVPPPTTPGPSAITSVIKGNKPLRRLPSRPTINNILRKRPLKAAPADPGTPAKPAPQK